MSEAEIIDAYNSLRKQRRDAKKSIVRLPGKVLTSVVYTSPTFAAAIVDYFRPQFRPGDSFLDPCAGHGAFFASLPKPRHWCEIQKGKDFLDHNTPVSWIFANYPWRGAVYSELSRHGFDIADNVVSLVKFSTALGTTKRFTDAIKRNMHLKEIVFCNWNDAGFTFPDGSKKNAEGFILSIIHWQRGWKNGTTWSKVRLEQENSQ